MPSCPSDRILIPIGAMAQMFGMNIRTLRFDDEIGILKAESVNPETRYRYYSTQQFERLNKIRYLRALHVPLEKISAFFENREVRSMLAIFEEQRRQLMMRREELARIERKIGMRIAQIHAAQSVKPGMPAVRHIPESDRRVEAELHEHG